MLGGGRCGTKAALNVSNWANGMGQVEQRERERRDQLMMRGKFNLDRNTSLTTHLPFLPLLSTEQVFSK